VSLGVEREIANLCTLRDFALLSNNRALCNVEMSNEMRVELVFRHEVRKDFNVT